MIKVLAVNLTFPFDCLLFAEFDVRLSLSEYETRADSWSGPVEFRRGELCDGL